MGKNTRNYKKPQVFKLAGSKSLKPKSKAKPFSGNLKKVKETVSNNIKKIDKEFVNLECTLKNEKIKKLNSQPNESKLKDTVSETKQLKKENEIVVEKLHNMDKKLKKAGIIIVGSEILKGHVKDLNSIFLCKRLYSIGIKVCRISTVPDEIDEIAEEVSRFSAKFDLVFTTGGIGPTHDDITYEAIACAMADKIILHSEMAEVIQSYFQGSLDIKDNPALKMALIPQSSKLIYILPKRENQHLKVKTKFNGLQEEEFSVPKKSFPVVQVRNVYVLPGMTEWMEHAFDQLQKIFENPDVNIYTMVMFLRAKEIKILSELNKAVAKFENQVIFGSYPSNFSNQEFITKITLEGTSLDEVTFAYSYLRSLLPPQYIINELQCKDSQLVYELTVGNKSLCNSVRNSLKIIEAAFKEYKSEEIYLSFNGGKDCTVLLHLVWAVNKMNNSERSINAVYIRSEEVFAEVDSFIKETTKKYNLNIVTIFGSIKNALTELHETNSNVKAIFVGTRRTDPYSEFLKEFQVCDEGWPPLMRVNPILDWSYHDIWDFLRILALPYCSLYEQGYTSIGNPKNTQPNPALKSQGQKTNQYLPAYKLSDGSLEREGRK